MAMMTSDSCEFYNSFVNLTGTQVYLKMVDTFVNKTSGDGSDREVTGIYAYGGVNFSPKTGKRLKFIFNILVMGIWPT